MSFFGSHAEQALQDLHADKLFLGVDGFHIDKGITTHFEPEAHLNRLMLRSASKVIVVMDSSKFGRICLHKILGIDEVSTSVRLSSVSERYTSPHGPMGRSAGAGQQEVRSPSNPSCLTWLPR